MQEQSVCALCLLANLDKGHLQLGCQILSTCLTSVAQSFIKFEITAGFYQIKTANEYDTKKHQMSIILLQ